jgi:hypothetical protein
MMRGSVIPGMCVAWRSDLDAHWFIPARERYQAETVYVGSRLAVSEGWA